VGFYFRNFFIAWLTCILLQIRPSGDRVFSGECRIPVPRCGGMKTHAWFSNSRNAVRPNYSQVGDLITHELALTVCGNELLSSSTALPMSSCNMPCSGNAGEICGGPNALLVSYSGGNAGPAPGAPTVLPQYGNWHSLGCYTDGPQRTLLTGMPVQGGAMTPQRCMDACHSAAPPFQFAGVEYAGVSFMLLSLDLHPLIFCQTGML